MRPDMLAFRANGLMTVITALGGFSAGMILTVFLFSSHNSNSIKFSGFYIGVRKTLCILPVFLLYAATIFHY